jgi:hypothetical protein
MVTSERIKYAHHIGYRVNELGEIINPQGEKINGFFWENRNFFNIRNAGEFLKISVSKLQAFQKYGEASFEKGIVVRHLNQNSMDNSFDNIAIGTRSDSMFDQTPEQRLARSKHASSFITKFNHDEVYAFYLECKSYKKTMEKFNIESKGSLNYIIKKMSEKK